MHKYINISSHIYNTKCRDILSHNYFSLLGNEFESDKNNISADEMVDKFLDTSNEIGKSIKAFVPLELKEAMFHYLCYINFIEEKHLAYDYIKLLPNCPSVESYLDQLAH